MADLIGLSSNQWTVSGSETLHESFDCAALPATHDTHDTHVMHNTQDVSFADKIDKAESIRFSSRFKTSATAGFQSTELGPTEYVTNRMKVIDDGPGPLSDQAINRIRATEDVQLEIIDANLYKSHEQAEKFAMICDLNESLTAKVKDLEDTEPVQDGPSRELAAAKQEIKELNKELQIEKRRSAKLESRLSKCKTEPETAEQTDIAQLRLEKDMLLHQVKNLLSNKSCLESKLSTFQHVIQRLTTNHVQATPASSTSEPPPCPFGIRGSSEPTFGLFGIRGSAGLTPGPSGNHGFSVKLSNLPTYEGKRMLDNITAFLFALEQPFKNAAQAIGWVGTMGWGEHPVVQLKGDVAVWATHRFPMSMPIEWSTFCTELNGKNIQSNALDLVKCECKELSLKMGERVTEFNESFHCLCLKLYPHQPMPVKMLAVSYGYKIEKGNQRVYKDTVRYIGMHYRTATLEQRMEHLAVLETSLNKS